MERERREWEREGMIGDGRLGDLRGEREVGVEFDRMRRERNESVVVQSSRGGEDEARKRGRDSPSSTQP